MHPGYKNGKWVAYFVDFLLLARKQLHKVETIYVKVFFKVSETEIV